MAVPIERLYERTTTRPRRARYHWVDDGTRVSVGFDARTEDRPRATVEHAPIAGSEEAECRLRGGRIARGIGRADHALLAPADDPVVGLEPDDRPVLLRRDPPARHDERPCRVVVAHRVHVEASDLHQRT